MCVQFAERWLGLHLTAGYKSVESGHPTTLQSRLLCASSMRGWGRSARPVGFTSWESPKQALSPKLVLLAVLGRWLGSGLGGVCYYPAVRSYLVVGVRSQCYL